MKAYFPDISHPHNFSPNGHHKDWLESHIPLQDQRAWSRALREFLQHFMARLHPARFLLCYENLRECTTCYSSSGSPHSYPVTSLSSTPWSIDSNQKWNAEDGDTCHYQHWSWYLLSDEYYGDLETRCTQKSSFWVPATERGYAFQCLTTKLSNLSINGLESIIKLSLRIRQASHSKIPYWQRRHFTRLSPFSASNQNFTRDAICRMNMRPADARHGREYAYSLFFGWVGPWRRRRRGRNDPFSRAAARARVVLCVRSWLDMFVEGFMADMGFCSWFVFFWMVVKLWFKVYSKCIWMLLLGYTTCM